ncbi:MAG: hypothetical protein IPN23_01435 [Elusimicrobia bacterium]|nr:hypothetical protein [Elusimicrobiota bacterium]
MKTPGGIFPAGGFFFSMGALLLLGAGAQARAAERGSFTWFPVVFYTPETRAGLGVGGVLARPRRSVDKSMDHLSFYSLYTARDQKALYLFPEIYRGPWKARALLGFVDFPEDYFGQGPGVSDTSKESYTVREIQARPTFTRRVGGNWRAGVTTEVRQTRLRDLTPGGALAAGGAPGVDGGGMWGAGPAVEWDSRDNLFSPRRGVWFQADGLIYGNSYPHRAWTLDARGYRPAGSGVFAAQVVYATRSGRVPFYDLALLEGLRGVLSNQYRDRRSFYFQGEWRARFSPRWGGVLFTGAGSVWGDRVLALSRFQSAGGAGLRYLLNAREGISLRLDLGVSRGEVRPYFRMLEAF